MNHLKQKRRLILGRINYCLAIINMLIIITTLVLFKDSLGVIDFNLYKNLALVMMLVGPLAFMGTISGFLSMGKDFMPLIWYYGFLMNVFLALITNLYILSSASITVHSLLMGLAKTLLP